MPRLLTRIIAQIRRVLPLPVRAGAMAGAHAHAASAAAAPLGAADLLAGGGRSSSSGGNGRSDARASNSASGSATSSGASSMIDEGHPTATTTANDADGQPEVEVAGAFRRTNSGAGELASPLANASTMPSAKAYAQMAGLIERIGHHLDAQAERSDRMISMLERLPEALDTLSAIRGDSQTLIRVVSEHLEGAVERDEQLRSVLGDLSSNSGRQASVLELINQQLNQNQRTEAELVSTLGEFRETLKDMSATNARSITVLTELAQFGQRQQAEFTMILQKNNRMMMILSAVSVCVSAAGLIIALVALLRVLAAAG